MHREIHAPRGTQLSCKNWTIEAAYRMLQNNLDPQVAFDPDNLIVYGGGAKLPATGNPMMLSLNAYVNLSRTKRCWYNPASP